MNKLITKNKRLPARALEAVVTGWAIQHPFAGKRKG